MDLDEIKEIVSLLIEKDIAEFELERGDEKVRIRRKSSLDNTSNHAPYVVVGTVPPMGEAAPAPAVTEARNSPPPSQSPAELEGASAVEQPDDDQDLVMVSAPIVGTFYEASSPGAPPFVEVGDKVEPGQVLCIIEAMKLMNEIEAETGGVVVKRFVQNAQPVEYGEALFAIKVGE